VNGGKSALEYPGVPLNLTKDAVGVVSIIVVLNPFLPGGTKDVHSNAGLLVLKKVVLKESLHLILTNNRFDVVEELEALLIRNFRESIVWVVTLENWVDTGVSVIETIGAHVTPEGSITKKSFSLSKVLTVEDAADFSLIENGETFIEPETLPVSAGNIITGPRVSDLVGGNINLRLVTTNNGG
jgi:hypothetical protein